MPGRSAGLLLWRRTSTGRGVAADADIEVLIGHMGGPFWSRKDAGAWTIPKGEYDEGDDAFTAAVREFREELGVDPPAPVEDEWLDLGEFAQSRKRVRVWARAGDLDATTCVSNTFEMEWPPGSGVTASFPELDRVDWASVDRARTLLVKGQVAAVDALVEHLR